MTESYITQLRQEYPKGTRVMLDKMKDDHAPKVGTLGTVWAVDTMGCIFVHWDDGKNLGVLYGIDKCHVVK